jgi:cell wall assembly regulator SMI1
MKNMELLKDFELNESISEDLISEFERKQEVRLPRSYREFLRLGNGGEGAIGDFGYANLWKLEDITELNRNYQVEEYLPGYLLIGSDGSGEAFAIKKDSPDEYYVQVPFIGLSEEDCMHVGNTFDEFLSKLASEQ